MALRESVRALILDDDDNVLLVNFRGGGLLPEEGFWGIPGGGIEPGEDRLTAMQREMHEEVGLDIATLGPEVWTKTAHFPMGDWQGQVDHIHLARVAHFDPRPWLSVDELAAEYVRGLRWWSLNEIFTSTETFAPRAMPVLLRRLLDDGIPTEPTTITGF